MAKLPSPKSLPDEKFFLCLREAAQRLEKVVEIQLKKLYLTLGEYELLRLVEQMPGATAADVRRRLRIAGPSALEVIARVEAKGFLQREGDPKDARRRLLSLTSKGATVLRSARTSITALLRPLGLSSPRMAQGVELLSAFLQRLSSLSPSFYA